MPKKTQIPKQSLKIPKFILLFSKIIASILPKFAIDFTAKLCSTPIKHKIQKKKLEMNRKSIRKLLKIQSITKKVMVYRYGESDKKVILSHE